MATLNSPQSHAIAQQLNEECSAMINYALSSQSRLPAKITEKYVEIQENELTQKAIGRLTEIHSDLSNLISPAAPKTLVLFEKEATRKRLSMFGAVPLVRLMVCIAIFCLLGVFLMSLHPEINGDEKNFSLLESSGVDLLLNELFLLFAAGLGASFSALYNAQRYIKSFTYDPIHDSSYIVLFVMGLISGTLLATLIPVESLLGGTEAVAASGTSTAISAKTSALMGFGKPMLAILGGFSASIVYSILDRMKSTLNTMVQGDARSTIEANAQILQSQQKDNNLKSKAALANKFNRLQNDVGENDDINSVKQKIEAFRDEIYAS